jgi:hypothetical protein
MDDPENAAPVSYAEALDELMDLHRRYDETGGDTTIWAALQKRNLQLLAMGAEAAAGAERYADLIDEAR